MRKWKGRLVATLVTAAGLSAAWWALMQLPASLGYGIRAEFESLPEDDSRFEDWMQSQPGVVPYTVYVARNEKSVGVLWTMTQSIGPRTPPVPDYRAAFESFGYRGMKSLRHDWRGTGDWGERPSE